MCVGEESCGAPRTFFLQIGFPPDLQKLKKKEGKTKTRIHQKF
jgi:hypothetical protein